ncbi:transposable element Tcb1 transposase [Trichonephila clavipes]|nr:transposable element Tcb1 transposase [Trichonephila clavipes]
MTLCSLMNPASACNITLVGFEFGDAGLLNFCVMHCYTGTAPGIMVRRGIEFHCHTPLVHIVGTVNGQLYISEVSELVVFPHIQRFQAAMFHMARNVQEFFTHQIELLPCHACSPDLSPIENVWSIIAQRLAQDSPPATTQDQIWQYGVAPWTAVPQGYIQSLFNSMPERGASVTANNSDYTNY